MTTLPSMLTRTMRSIQQWRITCQCFIRIIQVLHYRFVQDLNEFLQEFWTKKPDVHHHDLLGIRQQRIISYHYSFVSHSLNFQTIQQIIQQLKQTSFSRSLLSLREKNLLMIIIFQVVFQIRFVVMPKQQHIPVWKFIWTTHHYKVWNKAIRDILSTFVHFSPTKNCSSSFIS